MYGLTLMEEILLTAIWRLQDMAYGVSIRKKITEVTGEEMIYGTLYNLLDQLVRKSYLRKSRGRPTPERGGRSKIYYKLTPQGIKALQQARELHCRVWDGIQELEPYKN